MGSLSRPKAQGTAGILAGPTIGGWLSDNYGWQWRSLINGPIGVLLLTLFSLIVQEPSSAAEKQHRRINEKSIGFDFIGFLLVATFLETLEVVLARGQEEDWFASDFIVTCAVVSGLAFLIMIPWEITRRNPIVDIDYWLFAWSRIYVGIGLPLMIPMTAMASYDGIPHDKMDQAAALITAARNIGGSVDVSLGNNVLAHRAQFHQSRLVELVYPSGVAYQEPLGAGARRGRRMIPRRTCWQMEHELEATVVYDCFRAGWRANRNVERAKAN